MSEIILKIWTALLYNVIPIPSEQPFAVKTFYTHSYKDKS